MSLVNVRRCSSGFVDSSSRKRQIVPITDEFVTCIDRVVLDVIEICDPFYPLDPFDLDISRSMCESGLEVKPVSVLSRIVLHLLSHF